MELIDCKSVRERILAEVETRAKSRNYKLSIVRIGNDPASEVYIRNKIKTAESVGIAVEVVEFPENVSFDELYSRLNVPAFRCQTNGIILQLPLPDHLRKYQRSLLDQIPWYLDVDGLSTESIGRLWADCPGFLPATPAGIMRLLPEDLSYQNAVIVNRSDLIGKPLAKLLLDRGATVQICHSKTDLLARKVREADIVITGIGDPKWFNSFYFRNDQTIIDCGISRDRNGKLCGDVDLESIKSLDVKVTPVPGGVGILTTAQLMYNVVKSEEIFSSCLRQN